VASAGTYTNLHLTQTVNHASIPPLSFLQAGCPFCCPTDKVKAKEHCYSKQLIWGQIAKIDSYQLHCMHWHSTTNWSVAKLMCTLVMIPLYHVKNW